MTTIAVPMVSVAKTKTRTKTKSGATNNVVINESCGQAFPYVSRVGPGTAHVDFGFQ